MFKRFHLPALMTLPVAIGGSLCFLLPPHLLRVEGQGLFNMYLEFLIKRSRFKSIQVITKSRLAATVMFSVLHTIVIFGFLKTSSNKFWFTSVKIKEINRSSDKENKCRNIHGSLTCRKYLGQVSSFCILIFEL